MPRKPVPEHPITPEELEELRNHLESIGLPQPPLVEQGFRHLDRLKASVDELGRRLKGEPS